MAPIKERIMNLGAEFTEVDCYTCRVHASLPKLLHSKHNGYGTKQWPVASEIEEARDKAKAHDQSHNIVIFIGKG